MPGKIIDINKLKELILETDNILIIPHTDPDADALGSALGLRWIFNKLGKSSEIICDTRVNDKNCMCFDIGPELDNISLDDIKDYDYIIAVDTASAGMLGKSLEDYKIDLVIDHHVTNNLFARANYINDKAAAAGEIIFDLAKELELELDIEFAKYIYSAIVSDSGAFKFSATTARTMRAAAELMETGLDFARLNRLIFENKSLEQIKIERLAYNNLRFYNNGRIAVINITRELKRENGLEGCELDGISAIPKVISGVEVGVLIKEEDNINNIEQEFRISLRSNEYVDVAKLAKSFDGGGHIRAAGFSFMPEPGLENPAEHIENLLIEKIESVL